MDKKKRAKSFRFGVAGTKKHLDYWYACMIDLKGFNRHKKKTWIYLNLKSIRRPVPYSEDVPLPQFCNFSDLNRIFLKKQQ